MKRIAVGVLKYSASLAILGWLMHDVQTNNPQAFSQLADQPKDWSSLALALLLCMLGVAAMMVRWYVLVRALELRFSLKDAFRLGSVGYLLNFVSVGGVGGDLFKAVFIAREQPGRRAQAVATVGVDRLIGLYLLFVVASGGILANGLAAGPGVDPAIADASRVILLATALGGLAAGVFLAPGLRKRQLARLLAGLPRVGSLLASLVEAVRMYRRNWAALALASGLSLAVHGLFVLGVFAAARGLPGAHPTLLEHFAIVPLSMLTGLLPLPMAGLGALEYVMDFCYQHASSVPVAAGQGLVVALAYRAITIAIAALGVVYLLTSRKEVVEVIHETSEGREAV